MLDGDSSFGAYTLVSLHNMVPLLPAYIGTDNHERSV